ncbi:MAG: heavy metal translocating P-type ATPase [Desulfobacterota bacterium]|nr:heavy metal translocating P-type ATPase [Thermodesulfobacteriota bacterium]
MNRVAQEGTQILIIPISGMTCSACVKRIEDSLSKIKELERVSLNLVLERATVEAKEFSRELLEKIIKTVKDLGYEVETNKAVIPVQGLSMIPAFDIIDKRLKSKIGITYVHVNPLAEEITVEFVPTIVSLEDVKKILTDLGLSILHIEDEDVESFEEVKKEKEKKRLKKRLVLSAILTFFVLSDMFLHFFFMSFDRQSINLALFFLTTPIFFYGGSGFLFAFLRSAKHLSFDMNALISVGSGSAYLYSSFNTFFPYIKKGSPPLDVYYETCAVIITLVLFGRLLELKAKKRAYEAIRRLASLLPKKATVIRDGKIKEVPLKEIKEEDVLLVRPGERIPVDGLIIDGYGTLDESSITGEAIPKEKKTGDWVYASSLNLLGAFKLKVQRIGKDTLLSQIVEMVKRAQARKAPVQALADKIASIFVPTVFFIAFFSFLVWLTSGYPASFSLMIFVSVLIVACPCALGLATPIAIFVASSKAAEYGILVRNGEAFDSAKKINYVLIDKTGTLTYGKVEVKTVFPVNGFEEEEIVAIAGSLEKNSEHPLGRAIVRYAMARNLFLSEPESFSYVPGEGLIGEVTSKKVLVGSLSFAKRMGVEIEPHREVYERLTGDGSTCLCVAIDGILAGFIAIGDTLREESIETISELKKMGIRIGLLTGDSMNVAKIFAKRANIDEVFGDMLPHEKSLKVEDLKKRGYKVAMVGDGINDAPALSLSDLGFAMGKGTDIAAQTSDVILINEDLRGIVRFLKLSRKTNKIVKENLFWAFFYNVLLIPCASGLFYPTFQILLKPLYASFAMTLSSLFVVLNSLRIKALNLGVRR